MNPSEVDPRIWSGVFVGAGGLAVALLLYWRYRLEDRRLALISVLGGIAWLAMNSVKAFDEVFELREDVIGPLGLLVWLLGMTMLVMILSAAVSALKRKR